MNACEILQSNKLHPSIHPSFTLDGDLYKIRVDRELPAGRTKKLVDIPVLLDLTHDPRDALRFGEIAGAAGADGQEPRVILSATRREGVLKLARRADIDAPERSARRGWLAEIRVEGYVAFRVHDLARDLLAQKAPRGERALNAEENPPDKKDQPATMIPLKKPTTRLNGQSKQKNAKLRRDLLADPEVGDEAADGGVQGGGQHAPFDGVIESRLQVLFHGFQFLPRDHAAGASIFRVFRHGNSP